MEPNLIYAQNNFGFFKSFSILANIWFTVINVVS